MTVNATMSEQAPSPPDILKPAGQGTPATEWWRCCLPKETTTRSIDPSTTTTRRQRHITFDDEVAGYEPKTKSKEITTGPENHVRKDNTNNTNVYDDENDMEHVPDLDDPNTKFTPVQGAGGHRTRKNNPHPNLVSEFFHLIFQMFFLQWIRDAHQKNKKIKNHVEEDKDS
ncbi:hypothetical protein ACA910_007964 [Epithemia clementina (nom. ined.)]